MIKIIVDSTCYVSEEYAKANDIKVIDLSVGMGEEVVPEGKEGTWDKFFGWLSHGKNFPKTSQPSPGDFEGLFKDILDKGKDVKIIVLTLSQTLSGTYSCAKMCADNVDPNRVFVVDSGQTAQSQLLILEEIVDMIKKGMSIEKILEALVDIKKKACIQFIPQSMEYLKRGGRISILSAAIADILNIKPILSFNEGKLTCAKKVLGMMRGIQEIVNNIPKTVKKIYVCHIHHSTWLPKLIERVNKTFNLNIQEGKAIGPVIGSHIGIGAIGIAYMDN